MNGVLGLQPALRLLQPPTQVAGQARENTLCNSVCSGDLNWGKEHHLAFFGGGKLSTQK